MLPERFATPRRLAAALLLMAGAAAAQPAALLQPATLRAERAGDAAALATLPANERVELQRLEGGWARVVAAGRSGWVRASQLDLVPPATSTASRLESGRRADGASALTLGVRTLPPRRNRHALIIGVGRYRDDPARPVAALEGVAHDMRSALEMAALMRVPPEQVTLLRDADATRERVQQAIDDLAARVQPGDRVFLYWSGHGSRYFDEQEGGCVETLVPHDLRDIGNREFAQWLQPVSAKADKLFVVYDACHSGGVGGAAVPSRGGGPRWTPKFSPAAAACLQPSNLRTRSLVAPGGPRALPLQDVVHLSSSRPDEVSFDSAESGGLATFSLLRCLQGEARDRDGSGAVSVDELAACAQARVDAALRGHPQLDPPHLVVSGNRAFVPTLADPAPLPVPLPSPMAAAVPQPVATPLASLTPMAGAIAAPAASPMASTPPGPTDEPPPPAGTASPPALPPVQRLLEHLDAQRDGKRRVEVRLSSPTLRIGVDTLDFAVTSSHDGYVYVAMRGSDQQSLHLLFPNELDRRNRIAAGETLLLPRPAWRLAAGGPAGETQLLVMVTDGPRDLSALGAARSGPFARALTDADGRARLQWLLGQRAGAARCDGAGCSDAFGSALVTLTER